MLKRTKRVIGKPLLTVFTILAIMLAVSFIVIAIMGDKITGTYGPPYGEDFSSRTPEDFRLTPETEGIVEISNVRIEKGILKYDVHALKRGITFIDIYSADGEPLLMKKVYVHRLGIITLDTYFGVCTAGFLIPLSVLIATLYFYIDRILLLRQGIKKSIYAYRNIMNLGLIVFISFMLFKLVTIIFEFDGIDASIESVLATAGLFAHIVLPGALVISFFITLSNLYLMKKEGRNWRNMLGFFWGLGMCLMTLLPSWIYRFVMYHQVIDIFNEKGLATHIYSLFEYLIFFIISYLECVMIGTVVFGVRAAKHIPAFDKDYILILGSKIRSDGSLTPLLRGRADRAVEFAAMQKEATGKDLNFVPSGGKGSDEVMAEGDAIGKYLLEKGVPKEQILVENESLNTYENIRNSMKLIKERSNDETDVKVAFSTTNYHVFRAGLIAYEQGHQLEGIGSTTRQYFWVNAFIREFIATLVSEKRHHLRVFFALLFGVTTMVIVNYISVLL